MHDSFRAELGRLAVIGLLILLFGQLSGVWWLAILLGLGGYLIWLLRQVYLLEAWLHGMKDARRHLRGIWFYVAERMERTRNRARNRKKRLSRLLHRFYDTLEALPDAAVILEEQDRVEWFNSAAGQLLGLNLRSRHRGQALGSLVPDSRLLTWLAEGDFSHSLEIRSPADPGRQLMLQMVSFGKGQRLLTGHDITELKRVQAVRRDFIANVSHELRTPLTVVVGYLEMLAAEVLPDDVARALEASRRQVERMQRLVADLLMLSRLEMEEDRPAPAEVVDVADLLTGLAADARLLSAEREHPIHIHADRQLGLTGSESELASAFGNLLFNAVLHTPAGTAIHVYWGREGEGAQLVVEDQGPGIAAEHLARLTERFYRVDKSRSRERGGTGLGLSIVRHVLKRHGAGIEIRSKPGQGSRFICLFPASRLVKL